MCHRHREWYICSCVSDQWAPTAPICHKSETEIHEKCPQGWTRSDKHVFNLCARHQQARQEQRKENKRIHEFAKRVLGGDTDPEMIEEFMKATNPGGKGLYLGSEGDGRRGLWKGHDWQELKDLYGETRVEGDGDETDAETEVGDGVMTPGSEGFEVVDLSTPAKK